MFGRRRLSRCSDWARFSPVLWRREARARWSGNWHADTWKPGSCDRDTRRPPRYHDCRDGNGIMTSVSLIQDPQEARSPSTWARSSSCPYRSVHLRRIALRQSFLLHVLDVRVFLRADHRRSCSTRSSATAGSREDQEPASMITHHTGLEVTWTVDPSDPRDGHLRLGLEGSSRNMMTAPGQRPAVTR